MEDMTFDEIVDVVWAKYLQRGGEDSNETVELDFEDYSADWDWEAIWKEAYRRNGFEECKPY